MMYDYRTPTLSLFMLLAFAAFPESAKAAEDCKCAKGLLSFALGAYDVMDDDSAADLRIEYRSLKNLFWKVMPFFGIEATSDGSLWGGAGLRVDAFLSDSVFVTPSLAVGLYEDGGSDLDLDHAVEFRSQLEIGYQFENDHRISLGFSHISNAGLGGGNPGTEILSLYYHIPFNDFSDIYAATE